MCVLSDPGLFPKIVCTAAQIRGNPAERGRKLEEFSRIAGDLRREHNMLSSQG